MSGNLAKIVSFLIRDVDFQSGSGRHLRQTVVSGSQVVTVLTQAVVYHVGCLLSLLGWLIAHLSLVDAALLVAGVVQFHHYSFFIFVEVHFFAFFVVFDSFALVHCFIWFASLLWKELLWFFTRVEQVLRLVKSVGLFLSGLLVCGVEGSKCLEAKVAALPRLDNVTTYRLQLGAVYANLRLLFFLFGFS